MLGFFLYFRAKRWIAKATLVEGTVVGQVKADRADQILFHVVVSFVHADGSERTFTEYRQHLSNPPAAGSKVSVAYQADSYRVIGDGASYPGAIVSFVFAIMIWIFVGISFFA